MSKICQPGFNFPSIIRYSINNVSHVSAQTQESTCIALPTHIPTEDNNTSHTQIVEPATGFTLAKICCAQTEPKLTVQQLLEIETCKNPHTNIRWYLH